MNVFPFLVLQTTRPTSAAAAVSRRSERHRANCSGVAHDDNSASRSQIVARRCSSSLSSVTFKPDHNVDKVSLVIPEEDRGYHSNESDDGSYHDKKHSESASRIGGATGSPRDNNDKIDKIQVNVSRRNSTRACLQSDDVSSVVAQRQQSTSTVVRRTQSTARRNCEDAETILKLDSSPRRQHDCRKPVAADEVSEPVKTKGRSAELQYRPPILSSLLRRSNTVNYGPSSRTRYTRENNVLLGFLETAV